MRYLFNPGIRLDALHFAYFEKGVEHATAFGSIVAAGV